MNLSPDLMLSSGVVEGPFKRMHPLRRRPIVRFWRELARWLMAPSPWI